MNDQVPWKFEIEQIVQHKVSKEKCCVIDRRAYGTGPNQTYHVAWSLSEERDIDSACLEPVDAPSETPQPGEVWIIRHLAGRAHVLGTTAEGEVVYLLYVLESMDAGYQQKPYVSLSPIAEFLAECSRSPVRFDPATGKGMHL